MIRKLFDFDYDFLIFLQIKTHFQLTKVNCMITRRDFVKLLSFSGLASVALPASFQKILSQTPQTDKPKTNIGDALKFTRNINSMPGKFPGRVVQLVDKNSIIDDKFNFNIIDRMIERGMLDLTGAKNISEAWLMFVSPNDKIGLKVNPIGGPLLSTSVEITKAIIKQLEAAGIPKKNIIIWDRRDFQLAEAGFTNDNFPNVGIIGTEQKDKNGSFYDDSGNLYSDKMIDKDWYYWADVDGVYDAETLPFMINSGKYSYFTKIVTQQVDKIINIPILKNAGSSVTLCLKNLAYGSISNTGRLHKQLWAETSAEVCCFPPLRDKVVLNIVDGIRGCYDGGPAANPQFFHEYKTILIGTDPVAVDRIGYDIILKKRLEEKIQKEDSPKGRKFLELAENIALGTADLNKINFKILN